MVDHKKVEQAIRLLLEGISEDPDREGLAETPDRIARMYEEICGGMNEDAAEHLKKTFTAENNEMVVEKDITFYSMCEHHMLPFYGKVPIAKYSVRLGKLIRKFVCIPLGKASRYYHLCLWIEIPKREEAVYGLLPCTLYEAACSSTVMRIRSTACATISPTT